MSESCDKMSAVLLDVDGIYVGDRFEIDNAGALEAGMQAFWLTSSTKTRVMPQNCRHITKFADLERLVL